MAENITNQRVIQKSYVLNKITYLKRCTVGNYYVAPGFPWNNEIHEDALVKAGAKLHLRYGWERELVPKKTDDPIDPSLSETIQKHLKA